MSAALHILPPMGPRLPPTQGPTACAVQLSLPLTYIFVPPPDAAPAESRRRRSPARARPAPAVRQLVIDWIGLRRRRRLRLLDEKPHTRLDCASVPRPCPWASCAHHLKFDVHPETGELIDNAPGTPVHEMRETCSLDVADRRPWDSDSPGTTFQEIGDLLHITLEGARKIYKKGVIELQAKLGAGLDTDE